MSLAPFIACVGGDADRVRGWVETTKRSGLRARGFSSASAAIHLAASMRFDVVVADWSLGKVDAEFLAERLRVALGSAAPPLVVLAGAAERVSAPSRFAAVLPAGCAEGALLGAIEQAVGARRQKRLS